MKQGDRIPGLIGWEYHGDPPADIPGLEVVAGGRPGRAATNPQQWTATIYPGPRATTSSTPPRSSGPKGSARRQATRLPWSHWSRPHGPDPRVQQITHNLLRRAIAGP